VDQGFSAIAAAEPRRVRLVEASGSVENVFTKIWSLVQPALPKIGRW